MALTLLMDYEIVNVGTGINVTDTTVYGGANPTRANSLVNFIITDKRTGELIEVTYDEETVEEILIPITHDGWYSILMTVTNAVGQDERSDEKVLGVIVTERFCACLAEYSTKALEKQCGYEGSKFWERLFCLQGQFIGLQALVERNDLLSADMAIERMGLECGRLNTDCGC